jgi:chromosome segregation ATPase
MTEIVERLERQATNVENDGHVSAARAMHEAADLIEQQAASLAAKDKEIERLANRLSFEQRAARISPQVYRERAEQAERALAKQATFRERDKAEIAELRASVDKLTNSTDNGALCLEINDLTARLADALSEVGGLRRALAEAVEVMRPFADLSQQYDDTVNDGWVSWFEFITDHAWPSETECKSARAFIKEHGSDSREGM